MASIKLTVIDPAGIHARPASVVSATASKFKSSIKIEVKGRTADMKSIMNVMALGVKKGQEFTITADGEDADEAIKTIEAAMKENKLI